MPTQSDALVKPSFRKRFNRFVSALVSTSILATSISPALAAGPSPQVQNPNASTNIAVPTTNDVADRYKIVDPSNRSGAADGEKYLLNKATTAVSSSLQDALKSFGTAKVTISNKNSGSLDLLHPIYDDQTSLWFMQGGIRRSNQFTHDYRTTMNIGGGYRYMYSDRYMLGLNAFYDHDLTEGNRRMGVGAEVFADYMKLSANGYMRASNWRNSPDLQYYMERPANGFDIRFEGFLPQHPQLGAKIMYEKYYGDEVGLFGYGSRQKNPSATTLGLTYSPAPALTFGIERRMGQGGMGTTTARVDFKYQIGVPLSKQLDFNEVAKLRKVRDMRMNLVERNNHIVLEYKQSDNLSINLPARVTGYGDQVVDFAVNVSGDKGISQISWEGTAAAFVQSWANGSSSAKLTLPAYKASGSNVYTLVGTSVSHTGRQVRSNEMAVVVNPVGIHMTKSKAAGVADGLDEIELTAKLQGVGNEAVPGKTVSWQITSGTGSLVQQETKTNANGEAKAKVVSSTAGNITVKTSEVNSDGSAGSNASDTLVFNWDSKNALVSSLTATPMTATANGADKIVLRAFVVNQAGSPAVSGIPVTWTADGGALASASTVTDNTGHAQVELTAPTKVSKVTVVAKASAVDPGKNVVVTFVAGAASVITMAAAPSNIIADGVSTSEITTTVKDAFGNLVPNTAVTLASSGGTLVATTGATDANGVLKVNLVSSVTPGVVNVTAKAGTVTGTAVVNFMPGAAASVVVTATPASIVGNGTSTSALTATVKDVNGNLIPGATVSWSTNLGTILASSVTDTSGVATSTLTSGTTAGTSTVTAISGGKSGTASVTITAGPVATVSINALPLSITANGTSASTLNAIVRDAAGNLISGATVNWTTSSGTIVATSWTNAAGLATTTLTSSTAAGTATVTANIAGNSASTPVIFVPGPVAKIVTTASPSSIVANGVSSTIVSALVTDAFGNGIPNLTLAWSTNRGGLSSGVLSDASGVATVTLTSGTAAGVATVRVFTMGISGSTDVTFTPEPAASLKLTRNNASIPADGVSTSIFTAHVANSSGAPIVGATVTWTTNLGSITGTSVSDGSGNAIATLTSGVKASTATVIAASGSLNDSLPVEFTPGPAVSMMITSSAASLVADGVSSSQLTATVTDIYGNPIKGTTVNWVTSLGTVIASSMTDNFGVARSTLTSGVVAGTATLTATSAGASAILSVPFTPAPVTLQISSSAPQVIAGKTATVTAILRDSLGAPIPNAVVTWTSSPGVLSATGTTDASGVAAVVFNVGYGLGNLVVTAQANGSTASTTIEVLNTYTLTMWNSSVIDLGGGMRAATVYFRVTDVLNRVVPSAVVEWVMGDGSSNLGITDANGETSTYIEFPNMSNYYVGGVSLDASNTLYMN